MPTELWDLATCHLLLNLNGFWETGVAFSPDGERVAYSSRPVFGSSGGFHTYALEPGRDVQTLRGLMGPVERVWFSPDGRLVAALSHDWRIAVWDREKGWLRYVLEAPEGWTIDNAALAFSANGKRLAFAAGTNARLWDLEQGKEVGSWQLWRGLGDRLVFTADGKLLLGRVETRSGVWAPKLPDNPFGYRIRDLLREDWRTPVVEVNDFPLGVYSPQIAPDGTYFTVEGRAGSEGRQWVLAVYEFPSGKPLRPLPFNRPVPSDYVLDPTGTKLAFSPEKETRMTVLEMPSGRSLESIEPEANSLGPEARYWSHVPPHDRVGLAYGFRLYRRGNKAPLVTLGIETAVSGHASRFSLRGDLFAWGTRTGTVHVCDIHKVRERLAALGLGW